MIDVISLEVTEQFKDGNTSSHKNIGINETKTLKRIFLCKGF